MPPLRAGLALAITVGVFYALCTLVWAIAPGPFLSFMNNLFHGIDFTAMVQPSAFSLPGFALLLVVLSCWAMLAGAFYTWMHRRLAR